MVSQNYVIDYSQNTHIARVLQKNHVPRYSLEQKGVLELVD